MFELFRKFEVLFIQYFTYALIIINYIFNNFGNTSFYYHFSINYKPILLYFTNIFFLFQHLTAGINCEKCIPNYFRPNGISADAMKPCIPCDCDSIGSDGPCNPIGGQCKCRKGYAGEMCTECAPGFKGPHCTKCACDGRGTMEGGECESHCQCKVYLKAFF